MTKPASFLRTRVVLFPSWRRRFWSDYDRQTAFPSENLHHTLDRLISLKLPMHKSSGVIRTSDNLCAIHIKTALDRYRFQQVGEYLRTSGSLGGKLGLAHRRLLREMSEVLAPLIQNSLALLRSPTPSSVVESDGDAVERLDMRGAHSRGPCIHQRGEYPSAQIRCLARPLNPLLRLDGQHGSEQGCENDQTIADRDRALSGGYSGGNSVRGRNDHSAPLGSFPHSATEPLYG